MNSSLNKPKLEPTPKWERISIILILCVAFILRIWGNDFGDPGRYRPDEEYLVGGAMGIAKGNLNPHFFIYPSLSLYILAFIYKIWEYGGILLGYFDEAGFDNYQMQSEYFTAHLVGRYLSGIFGVLGVWATYRLGKMVFNPACGILAALLMSANYGHVRDSHFCTTDTLLTLWVLMTLIATVKLSSTDSIKNYIISGFLAGLAFSTKYPGLAVISVIPLAHCYRTWKSNLSILRHVLQLSTACISFVFAFASTSPFVILDWETVIEEYSYQIGFIQNGILGDKGIYGWNWFLNFALPYAIGDAQALTFIICLLIMPSLIRSNKNLLNRYLFLLVFPAGLLSVFLNSKWLFMRYITPMMPMLSILISSECIRLTTNFNQYKKSLVMTGICTLLIAAPLLRVIQTNIIFTKVDTRIQANTWLKEHIKENDTIGWASWFMYPKPDKISGVRYLDFNLTEDFETLKSSPKPYWIIVDSHPIDYYSPPLREEMEEFIVQNAKLKVEFKPFKDEARPIFEPTDAFYVPLDGYKGVTNPGPHLLVYKVE